MYGNCKRYGAPAWAAAFGMVGGASGGPVGKGLVGSVEGGLI